MSCSGSVKAGSPGGALYFGCPELGLDPPAGKSGMIDGVGDVLSLGMSSSDPGLDVSGA